MLSSWDRLPALVGSVTAVETLDCLTVVSKSAWGDGHDVAALSGVDPSLKVSGVPVGGNRV